MRMDMNTTKKKKKRCKTHTVGMTTLKVYDTEERTNEIGYGWLFHTDHGMTTPELFYSNGDRMDKGWYYLSPDENKLAVMGETIQ
jgi:hypothetical protein